MLSSAEAGKTCEGDEGETGGTSQTQITLSGHRIWRQAPVLFGKLRTFQGGWQLVLAHFFLPALLCSSWRESQLWQCLITVIADATINVSRFYSFPVRQHLALGNLPNNSIAPDKQLAFPKLLLFFFFLTIRLILCEKLKEKIINDQWSILASSQPDSPSLRREQIIHPHVSYGFSLCDIDGFIMILFIFK